MHFSRSFRLLVTSSSLAFPCVVAAQQEHEHDDTGVHVVEEVHVTGVLRERSADELAQSITVIREQTLERITRGSLGETLAGQVGVSSSYFAAGASRPIIRGLAGARVRTMEDGLDTMDASTVSVDHAVSIDPVVAQQIEIFRGPTTLLYGSGAVGGVVNTVTSRIPEYAPDDGFEGVVELRGDTVAGARSGVLALDGGGEDFAWHFDVISREADEYEIPGYADLTALEEEHEDEEREEELPGLVENSDLSGQAFSLGGSWLRDNGFLGVSVSGFDTNYGIPGHHHHPGEEHDDAEEDHHDEDGVGHDDDHEEEEQPVRVALKQTRINLKGGWVGLSGPVEAINLRFGVNDYEHEELEGDEVGTRMEKRRLGRQAGVHARVVGRLGRGLRIPGEQPAVFRRRRGGVRSPGRDVELWCLRH